MRPHMIARVAVAASGALLALPASSASAQVGCPGPTDRPCITGISGSAKQFQPRVTLVTANWSGNNLYTHYNLRVVVNGRSGPQFEVSASTTDQLNGPHRRHTWSFNDIGKNATITVNVQGCVRGGLLSSSRCSPWTSRTEIVNKTSTTPTGPSPQVKAACDQYARTAVGAVKLARLTYRCSPSIISGPRWTSNFSEHFNWCVTATPAARASETKARTDIMHQCRLHLPGGAARLSVALAQRGDFYTVTGSGFAVNAPVVVRVSGPASRNTSITVVSGQRIIADARGNISIRLPGVMVCNRAGQVSFMAESGDNIRSNTVASTCRAN